MSISSRIAIQILCAQRDYTRQHKEYEKAQHEHKIALQQLLQAGTALAKIEERIEILRRIQGRSQP